MPRHLKKLKIQSIAYLGLKGHGSLVWHLLLAHKCHVGEETVPPSTGAKVTSQHVNKHSQGTAHQGPPHPHPEHGHQEASLDACTSGGSSQ